MKNWEEIGLFYSMHKTAYEWSHKDWDGNQIVEEQLTNFEMKLDIDVGEK